MASPVDTSVKYFHSGMVGAPILSGQADKLIDVWSACLVDGFDVKTATSLVVASGVATLNFVGTHSADVDAVILVAGATPAALNGEQKVTAINAGQVKFATAAADGTATGSITFKMAPAGFEKKYTGTNLAVYKSLNVQAHGMFFQLNDADPMDARVIGYETMTAVSTGTGPFPTTGMLSGGAYFNKSATANAVATPWELFSDGRFVYWKAATYAAASGDGRHSAGWVLGFGDCIPLKPSGDPWATIVAGGGVLGVANAANSGGLGQGQNTNDGAMTASRTHTGAGAAVNIFSRAYSGLAGVQSGQDYFAGDFPSVVSGKLILSRRFIGETNPNTGLPLAPRADMPGMLSSPQKRVATGYSNRQKDIQATGEFAGRRLMAITSGYPVYADNTGDVGMVFFDITGPWR